MEEYVLLSSVILAELEVMIQEDLLCRSATSHDEQDFVSIISSEEAEAEAISSTTTDQDDE
eukprot:2151263-Heterocapsa_arctica.AAC.1